MPAAMAETAFRVAWLKLYYPAEFYCALLNEQPMGFYSPEVICNDARRHGIQVLPVDVRERKECSVEPDPSGNGDGVRLGYRYVKGLGDAASSVSKTSAERPYRSLWDFWRRTRLSAKRSKTSSRSALLFSPACTNESCSGSLVLSISRRSAAAAALLLATQTSLVSLPRMTRREQVITDLSIVGIAVRGRTMDLVAESLHEGITPSDRYRRCGRVRK